MREGIVVVDYECMSAAGRDALLNAFGFGGTNVALVVECPR